MLGKRLAYVLRHRPDSVGLTLDPAGWADLNALAQAMRVPTAAIARVVAEDEKGRFVLSPDGRRIRAAQGHSVTVDLGLPLTTPPTLLFHGTVARFVASIRAEGLRPGSRQHVHLSADRATATHVGARRGRPVILTVRSGELAAVGHPFWLSQNEVWLTTHVPPEAID